MNTALLRRVRSAILAHPDQFEMAGWFTSELRFGVVKSKYRYQHPGGCGTAGCIAGWTTFLVRKMHTLDAAWRGALNTNDEAVTALGINGEEALRLFYVNSWPKQFRTRYNKAKSVRPRARAAAERISHFISTKGAE